MGASLVDVAIYLRVAQFPSCRLVRKTMTAHDQPPTSEQTVPKQYPHYCPEWDYLWIRPGDPEYDCCICEWEDDMTEQPPIDLAEGERLLAASTLGQPLSRDYECHKCEMWHLESEQLGGGLGIRARSVEDVDAIVWLLNNGEALVTALRDFQALHCTCKFNAEWPEQPDDIAVQWAFEECPYHEQMRTALRAAQTDIERWVVFSAEQEQDYLAELTKVRADLARVEADKELLSEENALLTLQVQRVEAERDEYASSLQEEGWKVRFRDETIERLQARIVELEASNERLLRVGVEQMNRDRILEEALRSIGTNVTSDGLCVWCDQPFADHAEDCPTAEARVVLAGGK